MITLCVRKVIDLSQDSEQPVTSWQRFGTVTFTGRVMSEQNGVTVWQRESFAWHELDEQQASNWLTHHDNRNNAVRARVSHSTDDLLTYITFEATVQDVKQTFSFDVVERLLAGLEPYPSVDSLDVDEIPF